MIKWSQGVTVGMAIALVTITAVIAAAASTAGLVAGGVDPLRHLVVGGALVAALGVNLVASAEAYVARISGDGSWLVVAGIAFVVSGIAVGACGVSALVIPWLVE